MLKQFVLSIGLFCSVAYGCGPEDITTEQLMEADCIEIANTIHAVYGLTKDWTTYDTILFTAACIPWKIPQKFRIPYSLTGYPIKILALRNL